MSAAQPNHWDPRPDPAEVSVVADRLGARREVPLGSMTTLKVGGPAAALLVLDDEQSLRQALEVLGEHPSVPFMVLGRGSNILISDDGFPGIVLRLGDGFKRIIRSGTVVTAGAAAAMPALADWCANEGLAGLEFAAGVPATVGGSVRMNAGAHDGQVSTRLVSVKIASERGVRQHDVVDLHFDYRSSDLPDRAVVVSASWALEPDDPEQIRSRLDELRGWRRQHQPLGERTCGSVFTNPVGDSAGRLIEAAGFKGHRVGTARVSPMHANFIESDRGGSASDVAHVVALVRAAVLEHSGVELIPEVRMVGRFPGL